METPLRLLIIEDSDRDVTLEVRALEAAGYKVTYTVACTAAEMKAALAGQNFDIVISDHDLPQFNAPGALAVLKENGQDIPLIVVSGAIGEETAVSLIKAGAYDYLMKNHLAYLASTVERALKDAENVRERKLAKEALINSEENYRSLVENINDVLYTLDTRGNITYISPVVERFTGYRVSDLMDKPFIPIIHPDDLPGLLDSFNRLASGQLEPWEFRVLDKDGKIIFVRTSSRPIYKDGQIVGFTALMTDITERISKQMEYRTILRTALDGFWLTDIQGHFLDVNLSYCHLIGYSYDELMNMAIADIEEIEQPEDVVKRIKKIKEVGSDRFETRHRRKDGGILDIEISVNYVPVDNGQLVVFARDITERKQAEDLLRREQMMLARTEGIANIGSWEWEIAMDTVTWSDELFRIFQRDPQEGAPSFAEHPAFYHPDDFALLRQAVEAAVADGTPYELELRAIRKDGETRVCMARGVGEMAPDGRAVRLFGSLQDITERKRGEEKLLESFESLKKTLNDAINTMVKIVEMRDPYTAGHQQNVSALATAVAVEMKLEETRIDQLRTAAVIHDIGKMYVPSDILSKPGKLSDIEFSLIKTHARNGYDIVKGMDFPGIVAQVVLQHHERLDGSGYPNGIKGEEILLEAKILAVADVVEAMASDRPYRPAKGIDQALAEIAENRGRLYDPAVVDACLDLFKSGRFEFKSA